MLKRIAAAVALLFTLAVPAPASADVLVGTSHLSGRCINLELFNKPYDGGNHPEVETSVYRGPYKPRAQHPAKLIVSRTLIATEAWRSYTLACPASGRYTVRLVGWGWHGNYTAHVS
jgi:hypothetical protein